jgi:hypothetical protein
MRLSCRENDAGYLSWIGLKKHRAKVRFFLDGVEVKDVITADDEEGFLLVYVYDESGKHQLSSDRTEALTERRTGVVRIEVPAAV